ncbi:TonB-dependent receptor [Nitritalea halalkaliphila]|nr:TonB-dependent receptor [Nitritalea halalkaliphila]
MRHWGVYIALIWGIFSSAAVFAQQEGRVVIGRDVGQREGIRLSGRITDQLTGEPLVGATVRVIELEESTQITNLNGNFELVLSRAEYLLEVRYVGYETILYPFTAVGDGRISLRMQQEDFQLDDVVIFGRDPEKNIRSTSLGAVTLSTSNLKELPPFLGEVDIIRSMATLPGVSQVGEAAAGLNVRGGGADQNLFLFAGAPIYNPTHLFGLFTAFNPDIITDFTLFKAVVPAQYGGRGASILAVTPKTGSLDSYGGSLMLSTISGKATLNGPVVKDKVSFQLGARAHTSTGS